MKINFGVFKCAGKKWIKVKRNKNGLSDKQIENSLKQRKVNRPTLEVLLKETEETSYLSVGRKYGVTDNTIRKWIKSYTNI